MEAESPRRNAILHVLDGVFYFMGLTFFNRSHVVPAMVTDLGAGEVVLGLVALVALATGWFTQRQLLTLPQVFLICGAVSALGRALLLRVEEPERQP